MKARFAEHHHRRGLTLIEVVLIVAILAILAVVILPALYAPRTRSARMSCVSHLKQLSISFRLYASDWQGRLPVFSTNDWTAGANWEREYLGRWRMLSNEIVTPKLLVCPTDRRRAASNFSTLAAANASYFLNADAQEQLKSLLLGDRNLTAAGLPVPPGVFTLSTNFAPGWTPELHKAGGNLAFVDGSVQAIADSLKLNQALRHSAHSTNRLFVP